MSGGASGKGVAARVALFVAVVASAAALAWAASCWQAKRDEAAFRAAVIPNDLLNAADPRRGEKIAQACGACHSFERGGPKKVGPNLFGIVGRGIARKGGFEYSGALTAMREKVWTTDELYSWLRDPSSYAPGTYMAFGGLLDPQDRMDLISYLMTLHRPFPSDPSPSSPGKTSP